MTNVSFAYLVFAGVSAAIAAFSFYTAYLAASTDSSGVWLFAAFGLMFSVLPVSALVRMLASRSELFARLDRVISPRPAEPRGTRFVPHWMLLIGVIMMALLVLLLVVKLVRSFL